jgi:hypothetical protein
MKINVTFTYLNYHIKLVFYLINLIFFDEHFFNFIFILIIMNIFTLIFLFLFKNLLTW